MMGYRLISNLAIVIWVFLPFNISQFHLSDHPWEILRNAINKTYNRISDLRKEIQSLEKNVVLAEEGVRRTNSEYEAAEAKLEAMDGEPVQAERPGRMKRLKAYADRAKGDAISLVESLEAKEALLARALEENKALFITLYKNFGNVLMERLPPVSADGKLPNLRPSLVDSMAIDLEEAATMEVDGQTVNRITGGYNTGEQVQWCLSTLGYVKALSRQYATEIWPHMERLESEVFGEGVHPLFRKAIYDGLGRPE